MITIQHVTNEHKALKHNGSILSLCVILVTLLGCTDAFVSPSISSTATTCNISNNIACRSMATTMDRINNGQSQNKANLRSSELRVACSSASYSIDLKKGLKLKRMQLITLFRVSVPSIVAGALATRFFPALMKLYPTPGTVSIDFVGNFLAVVGLLYSLLVGQTYGFVYSQQEALYYALYNEVTEAKSLLEQISLVSRGRSVLYPRLLKDMSHYVRQDLCSLRKDPAILLSARPVDDPLESIMYLTSVGVPGDIYQTVKSLREARAARLGALQRKVPSMHMGLLYALAAFLVFSFPLLLPSTITKTCTESILFGILVFSVILTKRVMVELWRPAGGAYNVDSVLQIMIKGLESELKERMNSAKEK